MILDRMTRFMQTAKALPIARAFVIGSLLASSTCIAQSAQRATVPRIQRPGCETLDAHACLDIAIEAMGGSEKLEAIKTEDLDVIGHTELMEQSYRQAPFITSYTRDRLTVDFAGQRVVRKQNSVWPESDLKQADSKSTLIVTPAGGVSRSGNEDTPADAASLNVAREALALGPEKILLTARVAQDLHYDPSETLRATEHTALAFTWKGIPVRVILNRFNHLPDAVETTQEFADFWFYWGDVKQRVYFDNWRWVDGIEYPSNQVTERNGDLWSSTQAVDITFNKTLEDKEFVIDSKAAAASSTLQGWKAALFHAAQDETLADGIDLFLGSWNTTIVRQSDGVVVLETPISASFTEGLVSEVKKRYPDTPIKAVLSTSDSWPHAGGVRFDVAKDLPVYILDLNQKLLERLIDAPHTLDPDALQATRVSPHWKIVSGKTEIGAGPNRMVLYPLRGASTERQYMVYFPERRLLYASDTLVINDDRTLYDPELFHEVMQAVQREHLQVDTVFAMHQKPVPWSEVVAMLPVSLARL
jgi:hypothetical protein